MSFSSDDDDNVHFDEERLIKRDAQLSVIVKHQFLKVKGRLRKHRSLASNGEQDVDGRPIHVK